MQQVKHQSREILRTHLPLLRRIIAITSKRRRLSEAEEDELSRFVAAELNGPDTHGLGPFRGYSSLQSYMAVVVQRLCNALTSRGAHSALEPSPIEDAIRRTMSSLSAREGGCPAMSSLSAREALILKMWFESGMTTQKIATVLGMQPTEVHVVIAERTDGVQKSLAQSHTTPPTADD